MIYPQSEKIHNCIGLPSCLFSKVTQKINQFLWMIFLCKVQMACKTYTRIIKQSSCCEAFQIDEEALICLRTWACLSVLHSLQPTRKSSQCSLILLLVMQEQCLVGFLLVFDSLRLCQPVKFSPTKNSDKIGFLPLCV